MGCFLGGLFLAAGLTALFSRGAWVLGVLLTTIGVLIGLGSFGVVDVDLGKIIWPVVVIGIGLSILFRFDPSRAKNQATPCAIKRQFFTAKMLAQKVIMMVVTECDLWRY